MALFEGHFPYTDFHDLNLDWLLTQVRELVERMDQAEQDIDALEVRMDAAEADIDALEGRMDQAEQDIDALEGRMDTAEGDIDALEGRMDTAEGDIDALEGRMDTAEGKIATLEENDSLRESDIFKLTVSGRPGDLSDPENPVPLPFYTELGAGITATSGPASFTRCGNVIQFSGAFSVAKPTSGSPTPTAANTYIKLYYPAAVELVGTASTPYVALGSLRVKTTWLQDSTDKADMPALVQCYNVDAADTLVFNNLFDMHSVTLGNGWAVEISGTYITNDHTYYESDDIGPIVVE